MTHSIKQPAIVHKNIHVFDKIVARKRPRYHHILTKNATGGNYICTFGEILYFWNSGENSFEKVAKKFDLSIVFVEKIIMIYLHEKYQKEYEQIPEAFGHRYTDLITYV